MNNDKELALHTLYCKLTKREVRWSMSERYRWEYWRLKGWGEEELTMVVQWITKRIAKGLRRPESLRLNNLLEPSRFEDDLIDAQAELRKPKPSARARVLAATHRPAAPSPPAKSADQVMRESVALQKLQEWKKENGM